MIPMISIDRTTYPDRLRAAQTRSAVIYLLLGLSGDDITYLCKQVGVSAEGTKDQKRRRIAEKLKPEPQ
jgi:hypothetical protein